MKAMRGLLVLVAASTFGGFAACNTTVGECWYYGEGSENAGVGVAAGGGVIVPTGPAGVGGSGDTPPPEPRDSKGRPPPECNEEEDDATELGERVCPPQDWGAMCSGACNAYDVFCPAKFEHTTTKEMGLLFKCCNCKGDKKCWYTNYTTLDVCLYQPENGFHKCGL